MPESSGDKFKSVSRRDFLKLSTALAYAGGTLAALGARERFRYILEQENKIDISLFTLPIPGTDEKKINFDLLRVVFPEMIQEEEQGCSFVNHDKNKSVVLDFGDLSGEKIRLPSTKVKVAVANVSWEDANKEENSQALMAGLVLRGNFYVRGSISEPPRFIGDMLHRTICFIGDGDNQCSVSDITLEGLKSFNQNENPDTQAPSPSYISADNTSLTVEGVKIQHAVSKPEGIDETTAQLAMGISICNSKNTKPLRLSVHTTRIEGLEWDGIYSNGNVKTDIDRSMLVQDRNYKYVRGTAVGSTFNAPDGYVQVRNTIIDYCKGVKIYTEKGQSAEENINIFLNNCTESVSAWGFYVSRGQRACIRDLKIDLDLGNEKTGNMEYYPIEMYYSGTNLGLDFDKIDFVFADHREGIVNLLGFANKVKYQNFEDVTLRDFFENRIENFGDISVGLKSEKEHILLTRESLLHALDELQNKSIEGMNPSGMLFMYDLDRKLFGVFITNKFDIENESLSFTEPYWFNVEGELVK